MEIDGVVKMTKRCPFTYNNPEYVYASRTSNENGGVCIENDCMAWDEKKKDCRLLIRSPYPFMPGSYGGAAND